MELGGESILSVKVREGTLVLGMGDACSQREGVCKTEKEEWMASFSRCCHRNFAWMLEEV
jgi:hypothetical protein